MPMILRFCLLSLVFYVHGHSNILFQKIHSEDAEEMIENIQRFPWNDYDLIHSGPYVFYIDRIDDLIKGYIRAGGWELHIRDQISKYASPGSTTIDVGAHVGQHTVHMAKVVGPTGKVIAIEPQTKIFRELFINMQVNEVADRIDFCWAAAVDFSGKIELPFLNPTNEGGTSLHGGGTKQFVDAIRIDDLEISNLSLIKIDVEGWENEVLDGALQTIKRFHPVILIEISRNFKETSEKLFDLGYSLFYLHCSDDYLALPSQRTEEKQT